MEAFISAAVKLDISKLIWVHSHVNMMHTKIK